MMVPEAYLQLFASNALYGEVGPNLVRLTGELRGKTVLLQWVLLDAASEDEVEDYRCASTEILANYYDEMIEEEFIRVAEIGGAQAIEPLAVRLFSLNLNPERQVCST